MSMDLVDKNGRFLVRPKTGIDIDERNRHEMLASASLLAADDVAEKHGLVDTAQSEAEGILAD
jgi:hypothetical protein